MEMSKGIELRLIHGEYTEKDVTKILAKNKTYQLKPFKLNEEGGTLYGRYGIGINNVMIIDAKNQKKYRIMNVSDNYNDPLFNVSLEMGGFLYPFVSVGEMV